MPKVWGYIRVSTAEQAGNGSSLDAQRAMIAEEYERNWKRDGFEWGGIQGDAAVSAKNPFMQRPGGMKVVYGASRGDVLIFTKIDRGFRNTRDALATIEMLMTMGLRPVFMDLKLDLGTPMGGFMFTVLSAFAQLERSMIAARIAEGYAIYKKKGLIGQPWFGIRLRGPLRKKWAEVDEDHYTIGLKCKEWYDKGYTYDAIAEHLNISGVRRVFNKREVAHFFKDARFARNRATYMLRLYSRMTVPPMVLGALKTTNAILAGRVKRYSKLPAGVAKELSNNVKCRYELGIAFAGEPMVTPRSRVIGAAAS